MKLLYILPILFVLIGCDVNNIPLEPQTGTINVDIQLDKNIILQNQNSNNPLSKYDVQFRLVKYKLEDSVFIPISYSTLYTLKDSVLYHSYQCGYWGIEGISNGEYSFINQNKIQNLSQNTTISFNLIVFRHL
jgi:hypothetical protein